MSDAPSDALAEYFNLSARDLLSQVTEYLRRELKVPQYSEMFSEEMQFDAETESLFIENPLLEQKIGKLRNVMKLVAAKIEADHAIKVSFGVFEGIKSLAANEVKKYRGLRVLKDAKSSFIPSFETKDEETKDQR
jgi:hypothetical protein